MINKDEAYRYEGIWSIDPPQIPPDVDKCYVCEQYYNKHSLSNINGFLFCNECLNGVNMELIENNE
jgi:hypothetical protein